MSQLTSSQFRRLLEKDMTKVATNAYNELPSMIDTFYNVMNSDAAWEEFFSVGDVPDIPEFNGKIPYLAVAPGFHTKIEHKEYGAGLEMERKLVDDDQYNVINQKAAGLMVAAHRTKEKLGVSTFSNAFSASFDFMASEEGVALCSDSHTTKAGTSTTTGFDNAGTSALSGTSVAATRIIMSQYRSDISERINLGNNLAIVVPESLADAAMEIVGTPKGLDSAEGNMNPQYKRYQVIPYARLDDSDANNWFMVDLDAMKKHLVWYNRIKPESENTVDFETKSIKSSVYFRCSYGHTDWRWIHGHNVS